MERNNKTEDQQKEKADGPKHLPKQCIQIDSSAIFRLVIWISFSSRGSLGNEASSLTQESGVFLTATFCQRFSDVLISCPGYLLKLVWIINYPIICISYFSLLLRNGNTCPVTWSQCHMTLVVSDILKTLAAPLRSDQDLGILSSTPPVGVWRLPLAPSMFRSQSFP